QLRAAMDLFTAAAAVTGHGNLEAARSVLETIFAQFHSVGQEPDLVEAKRLLDRTD
ncbi:MAG: hypothetical protein HOF11_12400, partial [Rhodospirillaceae bacterium]|nr:hypothetical protein [Rhodospirillaceae bacterium]